MTPVGHCLAGMTIGVLGIPGELSWGRKWVVGASLVFVANLPDLPVPGWGHDRYDISHSVIVTGVLVILGLWSWSLGRRLWGWAWWWALLLAAAWFSHLLLDTMYNHGRGLAVFWPLSDRHVALPLPWFETLKSPITQITEHSLRVFRIELLAYGGVLLLACAVRWVRAIAR